MLAQWCFCFLILCRASFGEGNGNPLHYSCLENPMDGGAWWAAVHGVVKNGTWLSNFTFTFHFHAMEKKMEPTPIFLPGESQGWGRLLGCHLWGHTDSDTTDATWQQQQGFPGSSAVKNLPAMQKIWVQSLVWEDPLEEGMATRSSTPA